MGVPCVCVPRESGERARQRLAERGLVDDRYEIAVVDGELRIPVTDPEAVPAAYTVRDCEPTRREPQTTPADLLDFDPSYERVGEVFVVDEDDPDRARTVADAIVASDIPGETVLNRASKVSGVERVRDWEVLAAADDSPTETVHREYGNAFAVDLAEVYFSPRLATERHRVAGQVQPGERVLDMFAGVGPFAIPAAERGAEVLAVDVNPDAVAYLRENAERNGVADRVTAVAGDVREVTAEYADWADRLVMNLPHSADEFLETAVALAGEEALVHYYDIQHESDPYGPGEAAIRAAADPDYEVTVETRHTVRSYAPHELNVVLDAVLRRVDG